MVRDQNGAAATNTGVPVSTPACLGQVGGNIVDAAPAVDLQIHESRRWRRGA